MSQNDLVLSHSALVGGGSGCGMGLVSDKFGENNGVVDKPANELVKLKSTKSGGRVKKES